VSAYAAVPFRSLFSASSARALSAALYPVTQRTRVEAGQRDMRKASACFAQAAFDQPRSMTTQPSALTLRGHQIAPSLKQI